MPSRASGVALARTRIARGAGGEEIQASELAQLIAEHGPWELEIGFGKGRYLLQRAAADPDVWLLGIEMVGQYFRLAARRARRRQLERLVLVQAEALYVLDALLPPGWAQRVHVYFPDPWPKGRHHKRRLFDPESLDLLLRALEPGGEVLFASDHLEYGELVEEILRSHPQLCVEAVPAWSGGPRTNYEAKYVAEGRPILRLRARRLGGIEGGAAITAAELFHPLAGRSLLVAVRDATE